MRWTTVFFACFAAGTASLSAQTVHDVISSLSDRQRVLVQRDQVRTQLLNEYNGTSQQVPNDSPINWVGVGANPSAESVNGQGVGVRIALVNQAVAEFDRIAASYVNVSVAELENASSAGSINLHRTTDFPPLPRATPENHQEILRQLAQRIRALRVLPWPSTFENTSYTGWGTGQETIEYDEEDNPTKVLDEEGMTSFSWLPSKIGMDNLEAEQPTDEEGQPITSFLVGEIASSSMSVNGSYSEDPSWEEEVPGPLRQQTIGFSMSCTKRAIVRATAEGAQGTQIGGTVRILSRSQWNGFSVSGAPNRFNASNGSFVLEGGKASGDVSLFGTTPPETSINGTWVTTASGETVDGPWLEKRFVEQGYQLKAASLLDSEDSGYSNAYHRAYERNWGVGCRFFSLFQPTFSRGVDATTATAKLDSVNRMLADNTADGGLLLQPRPGLLFGIDLGPGLNGAGAGVLGAGDMSDAHNNNFATGTAFEAIADFFPARRFDSSYALRIVGSANDYHVVYENNRSARTQSLPQLAWSYDDEFAPGGTAYDLVTLYRDWERPRLKQVVGRDLVANVTYNSSHYGGYTITVYRRPENAAAPVAGQVVDVEGLPVRTWTCSKPGAGTAAHPTDQEKLQVDGNANEKFEISAAHSLRNNGAGWHSWYDYTYVGFGAAWWWFLEGEFKWVLKLSDGAGEKWRKEIGIETANASSDPFQPEFEWETTVGTHLDGQLVGELTSDTLDPFGDASPSDWSYTAAGKTIVGTPVPGDPGDPVFRYGKLAKSVEIEFAGVRPDTDTVWNAHGLLSMFTEGPWKTEGAPDGTAWKITSKHNTDVIGTEWIEFTGASKLKRYTAPNGSPVAKGHVSVASTELEMGTLSNGMPGLPHRVTLSDDTGATYAWTIAADGSGSLVSAEGLLAEDSVSKGREFTVNWNKRGFTTASSEKLLLGGTLKTAGAAVPEGEFTAWGMPKKWKDDFSTLASSWVFDGNRSRTSSITSPLGLTTGFSDFDVMGRPGEVIANGIKAERTFTGFEVQTDYSGTGIQEGTQNTTTRDALGRLTADNTTWNGVVDNIGLVHGTDTVDATRTVGSYGTHTAKLRQEDGSLEEADGATLPFGGLGGDGVTVSNGLMVSRAEILNEQGQGTGAFEETHTDALGRVRKVVTPSKSGSGSATTSINYSNPDSTMRRVITVEASSRTLITEIDPFATSGAVTRSGVDVNDNGLLGASDRYTESVTEVTSSKVVTILKVTDDPGPGVVNGMREVLNVEWTPSSGETITSINGGEEEITTTPNRTTKTVTTTSTKGWTRTTALNSLGLPTTNTLSGAGMPTSGLTPVWRADGSLASVELTIGGEKHKAAFDHDGTLTSLVVPDDTSTYPNGREILGEHTIANGVEKLTVNGVTVESQLNGTGTDISGGDAVGRNETLTPEGGGFKHTVTPDAGGSTNTMYSAGLASTAKTYADDSVETHEYEDELLSSVTLARGGELAFGYSGNGAQDLTSATWPEVTSGPFSVPAFGHGFTYTRSGQIKTVADPSGFRTLGYEKGRLASTLYTAGSLKGYGVIRARDGSGRHTGVTLERDGATIHSTQKVPNGDSDQISALASGSLKVVPQRDAAGRITGYQWGNATGPFPALTQTWQRGAGGRIEYAGSDVPGAPSFDYLLNAGNPEESFDTRGRRLKCSSGGGTWTYTYGIGGQLERAVHRDASNQILLGDCQYNFDAVGRRTDKGAENFDDLLDAALLNQTTAWSHDQAKKLIITAHPDARVWFNGTEIPNFNGSHEASLGTPGVTGQWIEWETLAVLEGAGEGSGSPPANPLAHPDAKAEKRGAVWVPPSTETLAYDGAGNRQGNAQWDYGWDAKNQLVLARTKNYDSAPQGWDIRFSYDAEGRRFKKQVTRYLDGEEVEEKEITYLWNGWDLIYERHQLPSGLTTLERKYLWGEGLGGSGGEMSPGGLLLIRETKGGTTTDLIPLYDGTGHVIALTDLSKTLHASYAYGPFGEKITANGPRAQSNPWRFATKYFDEETGLYYFGHRYYDPLTGQWLSREPLGESESVNLYSYTGNDPVNFVDALGLAKVATDGRGNLTELGQAIVDIARRDPGAARSLLMGVQVAAEMRGVNVSSLAGDGGDDAMRAVLNAVELATGQAQSDARKEWQHIAVRTGADSSFGGYRDTWTKSTMAELAPLLAARAGAAAELDAIASAASAEQAAEQNSASYKLKEIGLGVADLPMHGIALAISVGGATDVTTGNMVTWEGWANWRGLREGGSLGLAEVSRGERSFSTAMVLLPVVGRLESVADDFVRVAARGRSFAGTAAKPWGGAKRGGIEWVSEDANMSARAKAYDSGAMGGRDGLAPRLSATDDFGTVTAKFDGVDDTGSVLIDRKLSVYGSVKADKQLLRQSAVLAENGWLGVWELPTEAAARAARAKMKRLGVRNINVRVVPE